MSGINVPKILDPDLCGIVKKKHVPTLTEKRERTERNFPKYYERELGQPLPPGSKGIVLIQQGHYPYDLDIFLNPLPSERCEARVMRIGEKPMMKTRDILLLFHAHTYWLEKEKLIHLLSEKGVLISERCERAVKIICKKMNGIQATSLGEKLICFKREARPYRVYSLSGQEEKHLFINLMTGAIFIIPADEAPEMEDLPETFVFGDITLAKQKDGNYKRF